MKQETKKDLKKRLPNIITNTRLFFLPFLIALIIIPMPSLGITFFWGYYFPTQIIIAFWLFVILAATDFVDGYLARRWDAVSTYGKFMDPILDKVLVLSTLIALVSVNLAPTWIAIIILVRETMVSGLRLLIAEKGIVTPASWTAKIKTFSTMIWICLLFTSNYPFEMFYIPVTAILGVFVAVITIYTGFEYYLTYKKMTTETND